MTQPAPQSFQDLAIMMGRVDERTHESKRTQDRIELTIKEIKDDMDARLKPIEDDVSSLKGDKTTRTAFLAGWISASGLFSAGIVKLVDWWHSS